jgi:hypothetical protein
MGMNNNKPRRRHKNKPRLPGLLLDRNLFLLPIHRRNLGNLRKGMI